MTPAELFERLHAHYGDQNWWPAETVYEVMVGAVLTQNTAWSNVEKAIARFGDGLSCERVLEMDIDELREIIRPAGFFKQKSLTIKALTGWYSGYGFSARAVSAEPMEKIRKELIKIKGIGPETADAILLYSFGFPSFVVDAYTMRLCERLGIDAGNTYDEVKSFFESRLPKSAAVFNEYHALIVVHGKAFCKKKPVCDGCPVAFKTPSSSSQQALCRVVSGLPFH